jgi:hypothetical protein
MKAISDASHIGLWYGSTWPIVRRWIVFVRSAQTARKANGLVEIENLGKKGCSMIV